ncbi:uncharacterized protein WCC33_013561 [Rhinophrynus dorsalis]
MMLPGPGLLLRAVLLLGSASWARSDWSSPGPGGIPIHLGHSESPGGSPPPISAEPNRTRTDSLTGPGGLGPSEPVELGTLKSSMTEGPGAPKTPESGVPRTMKPTEPGGPGTLKPPEPGGTGTLKSLEPGGPRTLEPGRIWAKNQTGDASYGLWTRSEPPHMDSSVPSEPERTKPLAQAGTTESQTAGQDQPVHRTEPGTATDSQPGIPTLYESDIILTGSSPGITTGSQLGISSGSNRGINTGSKSGVTTGSQPGITTGSEPGFTSGSEHGLTTGSGHGLTTGSRHGITTGSGHGITTRSGHGITTETGITTGSEPGITTGSETGITTGSGHDITTGSEPGNTTGSGHGITTGSETGNTTGSEPGNTTGSEPDNTTGSEPGWTEQDYTLTARQSSSGTELQKSATRRHLIKRTSHTDTTYISTTFTRGGDRTLLSVTNVSDPSDITEIPTHSTSVESTSRKHEGREAGTTLGENVINTLNNGTTTQDNGITTWENGTATLKNGSTTWNNDNTSQDNGTTRWEKGIPTLVSGTSTQGSETTTWDSGITTWDSGITTQGSRNSTQNLGITTKNFRTVSVPDIPGSGTDPLLTPSYSVPTLPPSTAQRTSDFPVTSDPVTSPNLTDASTGTEVLANNSFIESSSSSLSSSSASHLSSSSNSSLVMYESSSSTLPTFSIESFSSSAGEVDSFSSPVVTKSSSDFFSSSPIPSTLVSSDQSSASVSPSLSFSEIPSLSSSTNSYTSLTPTSTWPSSTPVTYPPSIPSSSFTSSFSSDITETIISPRRSETPSQSAESSSFTSSPVTRLSQQTTEALSTVTESAKTLVHGTDAREATTNSSLTITEHFFGGTLKTMDGNGITTSSTEKMRAPSVTVITKFSEAPTQTNNSTVGATSTSGGLVLPPPHHNTPGSPQPTVRITKPVGTTLTTDDPSRTVLTERTTNIYPNTIPSWPGLQTSTAVSTKSRKTDAKTTVSLGKQTVKYAATSASKPSTTIHPSIITPARTDSPCSSNPCQNGGLCVELGIKKTYRCECPPAWQGEHCATDIDECLSDPCPAQSSCTNTRGSFSCRCPLGFVLEKGTGCTLARTFLGHIKVPKSFLNGSDGRYSELQQIQDEIVRLLNKSFSILSGYYQSNVLNTSDTNHIIISVQNVFSLASNVTKKDIKQSLQNFMRSCESSRDPSPGCQLILHPQLYYIAEGLCTVNHPECDKDTTDCSDVTGIALCQCKTGYFKYTKMDHSCRACEDGFQRVNGSCVRCPFGLGGFNCSNPYQLITVIIASAGGGLLLVLGIALMVTCCRKNKNDISKLIFKSGDFQMSPYAEYPKTQRSSEWGRETIEMQENGSTKNLLQMTDVYYSPGLRNPELERNGLYPYTGLPGSRHSCIYPGQHNPSFISEENRRRDYF